MKNIHILLTSQPSRLYKTGNFLLLDSKAMPNNILETINQHIYITSDEEIKDCYVLTNSFKSKIIKIDKSNEEQWHQFNCKKIILTTDQDLINDGVQAIDDTFLEWFVKNPSCERVEVRKIEEEWIYNADVPKEEPKQEIENL